MAETRSPGRVAYETFVANMPTRGFLKWDYELFTEQERQAWEAVARAVVDDASRRPTEPAPPPGKSARGRGRKRR